MEAKIIDRQSVILSAQRAVSVVSLNVEHKDVVGLLNYDEVEAFYPVDNRTGFRAGDTSRLLSKELTTFEKEKIISRIREDKGTFMPQGLSDAEIMDLVPPRFLTRDAVDLDYFRSLIAGIVEKMDADAKTEVEQALDVSTPQNAEDHADA